MTYQFGLKTQKTNVVAQKIDSTTLETYKMVVSTVSVLNKDGKKRFFEESFHLSDVKPDVVLGMLFLTMSNVNVDFQAQELQWRSYTIRDVLLTTKKVELRGKKEFAEVAFDSKHKDFLIHIAVLSVDSGDEMHPSKRAQIAHWKADEVPIKVPSKYTDFADIFSTKLAVELLKYIGINDYAIELVSDSQSLYSPIYSLGSMKLEILKVYIKNNLANGFFKLSKSLAVAPIFWNKKPEFVCRWSRSQQSDNQKLVFPTFS